jgi:hypothetical protein
VSTGALPYYELISISSARLTALMFINRIYDCAGIRLRVLMNSTRMSVGLLLIRSKFMWMAKARHNKAAKQQ